MVILLIRYLKGIKKYFVDHKNVCSLFMYPFKTSHFRPTNLMIVNTSRWTIKGQMKIRAVKYN